MAFITLKDGRRIFVKNKKEGIQREISDIYGPEVANLDKIKRADTFQQAQNIARDEVRSQHGVTFVSPQKLVEMRKRGGGEFARQPGVAKFSDDIFKERIKEQLEIEKAKQQGSSELVLNKALVKAEEAKAQTLKKELAR